MQAKLAQLLIKKTAKTSFPQPKAVDDHYEFYSAESSHRCLSYKFAQAVTSGCTVEIPKDYIGLLFPTPELVEVGVKFSRAVLNPGSHELVFGLELKNGAFQTDISPNQKVACLYLVRTGCPEIVAEGF